MIIDSNKRLARRSKRVRYRLRQNGQGRPRLSVYRSGRNMYAQIIDDNMGITIVSASTLEKEMREDIKSGATCSAATRVGSLIAERAIAKGLTDVVFDRGGYLFHGRVKALADSARKSGLKF